MCQCAEDPEVMKNEINFQKEKKVETRFKTTTGLRCGVWSLIKPGKGGVGALEVFGAGG